ncbi:DUF421 domain-containing protein [Oceanobacillus polygoni]|uniref:Uncharacterized membrane protein YcaP (DUF421 family) n=1 Tax=Oceanobacillus polygoni TaxID=1235259 RepID=A0A9X1CLK1_9BACI|nr:DUF421 domain-containing protein [Oceanobacillus polygoni]MBP2080068.1 uncharacterized membrane protein YcaP (DUF421 family) [Oceanobacillus polygoni]
MDWHLIWKSVIMIIGGTFLLRIAGRKSISQMTLTQTVIMIGIGSLLIQPIAGEDIWSTLFVGLILVLTLVVMEFLQIKGDLFENIITGKSKVLIINGSLQEKNLKKLRMTVDQLEMELRVQNVQRMEDVQWATLEPNGQVGLLLKEEAQPVTKKEFKQLTALMEDLKRELNQQTQYNEQLMQLNREQLPPEQQETIFAEIQRKSHKNTPPKHLQ